MAQTEEKKEKTYTKKELQKALREQKQEIMKRIKEHSADSLHKSVVLKEIEQI